MGFHTAFVIQIYLLEGKCSKTFKPNTILCRSHSPQKDTIFSGWDTSSRFWGFRTILMVFRAKFDGFHSSNRVVSLLLKGVSF